MRILGIDPGIATTGYGVIDSDGVTYRPIDYGTINTLPSCPTSTRLVEIFDAANCLIEQYKPDAIAIEELFFNKNVRTALIVGHARGVLVLAAARQSIPLFEYTPLQVKQSVVGYGRAKKNQVQEMVRLLLKLNHIPKPDDAADALAVAICHINAHHAGRELKDQWGGHR